MSRGSTGSTGQGAASTSTLISPAGAESAEAGLSLRGDGQPAGPKLWQVLRLIVFLHSFASSLLEATKCGAVSPRQTRNRPADGAAASEQRGGCGVRVRAPGTPPRSGPRCPRGPARAGRASTSRRARREPRRPDRRARGQTLKPRPPSRACEILLRISISLLRVISIFDFLFIFSQLVRHFDNRIKPHTTRSHLRREVRTGFHDETKRSLERREPHPASLSSVKCLAERFYTPLQ